MINGYFFSPLTREFPSNEKESMVTSQSVDILFDMSPLVGLMKAIYHSHRINNEETTRRKKERTKDQKNEKKKYMWERTTLKK